MTTVTTATLPPRISSDSHQLYRLLIDTMLADGTVPSRPEIARLLDVAPEAIDAQLGEVAECDWIGVDAAGAIVALYPFSPAPTDTKARIAEVERHAMCAIDALGMAPLLKRTVSIVTTCARTGELLEIEVSPREVSRSPPANVAVVARRTSGAAHVSRCGATRFFRSSADAEAWVGEQGTADDVVLTLEEAFEAATVRFSTCYFGTATHQGLDCACS